MEKQKIYLDYNATAPLLPGVWDAMGPIMQAPTNPSALHFWGQQAKRWMNQARRDIADFIDCHPDRLIMTSGGTEANNLVLNGFPWKHVFMSAVAHDSAYKAVEKAIEVPVTTQGLIDLEVLEALFKKYGTESTKSILSVMHAHNETGIIQPLKELREIAGKYGVYVHVDSTQALGKIPFSFDALEVDFLTLSAHKVGGPQGVGALVAKKPSMIAPLSKGGGQERGRRSGTENVAGIVGFAEALKRYPHNHGLMLQQWHHQLEEELLSFSQRERAPCYIYGQAVSRLPNTTCVAMPSVDAATQVMRFDLEGIAVSMGAACSSGRTQVSRSLEKIGSDASFASHAIRVSSGWDTQEDHLLKFTKVWKKIYTTLYEEVRHAS